MADASAILLRSSDAKPGAKFFAAASARHYSTALSLLLVSPLLVLLAFAFIFPVGRLILRSFFMVTGAAFLFGYLVAFAMARLTGGWRTITVGCVLIPLWTSVLVRSYA